MVVVHKDYLGEITMPARISISVPTDQLSCCSTLVIGNRKGMRQKLQKRAPLAGRAGQGPEVHYHDLASFVALCQREMSRHTFPRRIRR